MKTLLLGNGFTRRYSEKFTYDSLAERVENYESSIEEERELVNDIKKVLREDKYFKGNDFEKAIEYLEFVEEYLSSRTSSESKKNYKKFLGKINFLFTKYVKDAEKDLLKEVNSNISKYQQLFYDVLLINSCFSEVYTLNFDKLYSYAIKELNKEIKAKDNKYEDVKYLHYDRREEKFVIGSIGENKVRIISENESLKKSLNDFSMIKGELHILGCSLEKSDNHIIEKIALNNDITKVYFYLYSSESNVDKLEYQKNRVKYEIISDIDISKIEILTTEDFNVLIEREDYSESSKRYFQYVNKPTKTILTNEYIAVNRFNGEANIVEFEEAYNLKHNIFIPILKYEKEKIIYHIINIMDIEKYRVGSSILLADINSFFKYISLNRKGCVNRNVIENLDGIESKIKLFNKKIQLLEKFLVGYVKKYYHKEIVEGREKYHFSYNNFFTLSFIEKNVLSNIKDSNIRIIQSKINLESKKLKLVEESYKSLVRELLFK